MAIFPSKNSLKPNFCICFVKKIKRVYATYFKSLYLLFLSKVYSTKIRIHKLYTRFEDYHGRSKVLKSLNLVY